MNLGDLAFSFTICALESRWNDPPRPGHCGSVDSFEKCHPPGASGREGVESILLPPPKPPSPPTLTPTRDRVYVQTQTWHLTTTPKKEEEVLSPKPPPPTPATLLPLPSLLARGKCRTSQRGRGGEQTKGGRSRGSSKKLKRSCALLGNSWMTGPFQRAGIPRV